MITPRILFAFLVIGLMTSCVGKKKFDEMVMNKDQELTEMKESMDKLKMDMQTNIDALNQKNTDLAKQKDDINMNLKSVKDELSTTQKDLTDVEYRVDQKQKQIDNLRGEINAAFANVEAAVNNVDAAVVNSNQRIKEIEGQMYLDLNDNINFLSLIHI